MKRIVLLTLLAGLAASAALANDSTAELKAGGLQLLKSADIAMMSEDLYISTEAIRVRYVFRNLSAADESVTIAFPMPDLTGDIDEMPAIADADSPNFMKFRTLFDGQPVSARVLQRAFFNGKDITDELVSSHIPLEPFAEAAKTALKALPADIRKRWIDASRVQENTYDVGKGWVTEYVPAWTLKTTYVWDATFPAGKDVSVEHDYTPAAGSAAGAPFLGDYPEARQLYETDSRLYCFDSSFLAALKTRAPKGKLSDLPMSQSTVSYVLTTGANWSGPIRDFHLTIDKGAPERLVSFCGDGVHKTGPTTFEMRYTNFTPKADIAVLIMNPWKP